MSESGSEPWVHPTALIDPTVELAAGVRIGPYCVVGPRVTLGERTILHPHVVIETDTTVGADCEIYPGAILGGRPQDTKYAGERSRVILGDRNVIRECVTIHRATGEGAATVIGDDNMIMTNTHIAHNCKIGSRVALASLVGVSGHVSIGDAVIVGGLSGIHQFARIGTLAMLGGMSGASIDVPPYVMAVGKPAKVADLNAVGLRRAGVSPKVRSQLREAIKLIYRSNLNTNQGITAVENEIETSPELEHLLDFLRETRDGHRGRGNNPSPFTSEVDDR